MSARRSTRADNMDRLSEMERQLQILQREQDSVTMRVDRLEGRWDTVKELLVKILTRVEDQGKHTQELAARLEWLTSSPMSQKE